MRVIDTFAGPGGWDTGLRSLGRDDVLGVEWDRAACDTALAAGHARLWADVAALDPQTVADAYCGGTVEGFIASPPCQDFSSAGTKLGETGTRGQLVNEPLRWVAALRPEWIALEQVPSALPVWRRHARQLRSFGYSTWTGILNAADFGVPQTRRRAVLMASRITRVAPPVPTHAEVADGLFGQRLPWVTMTDSLGWNGELDRRQTGAPTVATTRPAPTLTGAAIGGGVWTRYDSAGRKHMPSLAEASVIQSFPADYPWQGTRAERGQQVGDAIPPLLAAHVLAAVLGVAVERAA